MESNHPISSTPLGEASVFSPLLQGLHSKELGIYKLAAGISYLLALVYVSIFTDGYTSLFFPFAVGILLLIETPFYQQGQALFKKGQPIEASLFFCSCLAQALALTLWGPHFQLEWIQYLFVHGTFVFYVLARHHWLVQGRLGSLLVLDGFLGFFYLPWRHFLLRLQVVLYRTKSTKNSDKKARHQLIQTLAFTLISIYLTGLLVVFVLGELRQVSEAFSSLTIGLEEHLASLWQVLGYSQLLTEWLGRFLLSLPIGMWLYGLVAGSRLRTKPSTLCYESLSPCLQTLRVFPALTTYLLIGSLCLVYSLFFVAGLTELAKLLSLQGISPQEASHSAVAGFWQLVRVSCLNFALLAGLTLFSKEAPWQQKRSRLALTLLFVFAGLFALLAAWKLFGLYIFLFGLTPLRLLSAWFILVLLVWCGLLLIRFYRPIQAIRYGLLYALISFTLLCYLYPLLIGG